MGSRWPLAERRAQKMQQRFPTGLLVEIGAGIGGDSLELAHFTNCAAAKKTICVATA